ncbi:hypothetical protein ACFL2J_00220 [Candidatus Omnitrophota bacterium]
MGIVYRFKPGIVSFITSQKRKNPDLSCRMIAELAYKKFHIKLSKSSVNSILNEEQLSSPVGRRTKRLLGIQGEIEHGGFSILQGIDSYFELSQIVAETFINRLPTFPKELFLDSVDVVQALIMFKAIFDLTIEAERCYDNREIWTLVGRRPTRSTYNRIIQAFQDSQLTADEVVTDISRQLIPLSGIRFQLRDSTSFFVDAQLQSIWNIPIKRRKSTVTYCRLMSYINNLIEAKGVFSIFSIQGANMYSQEVLDFISALTGQNVSKRIRQIELIDLKGDVLETKSVHSHKKRFFLLGFWPWQLDGISELERKLVTKKLVWRNFGAEYYYQIEEVSLSQHLVAQDVKYSAILLKSEPVGAARVGILTNLPRDTIHKYLSIKELYRWIAPEDRYKEFMKWAKEAAPDKSMFLPNSHNFSETANRENNLNNIFSILSKIIFYQFQQNFVPESCRSWSPLKLKDVFLRQKATIRRNKEFTFHNILIDNELCDMTDLTFICNRLNEVATVNNRSKLPWFTCTKKLS